LSFHSVAVVPAIVQKKQIRINIHKENNTKKHGKNNTKHRKDIMVKNELGATVPSHSFLSLI
jgi:hypothetical protein